jgi:hypothetical protein
MNAMGQTKPTSEELRAELNDLRFYGYPPD